jgi:hypothetical protein
MLDKLLSRRWVCARYGYPHPEPQTFFRAFFQCIADGGALVYVG